MSWHMIMTYCVFMVCCVMVCRVIYVVLGYVMLYGFADHIIVYDLMVSQPCRSRRIPGAPCEVRHVHGRGCAPGLFQQKRPAPSLSRASCLSSCLSIYVYVTHNVCIWLCTSDVYVCVYIYIYTYIHTYIYIYIYTYIYNPLCKIRREYRCYNTCLLRTCIFRAEFEQQLIISWIH